MKTPITVLLTGASGTVGIEVLRQLVLLDEVNLTVFDQKTSRAQKLLAPYKDRINILYGDLCNENDLKQIPGNIDVAIHLAAVIPPLADEKPELTYNVNVVGTKRIIGLLENKSPGAFLLYSSSISVYGDRLSNPYITIADPLKPSVGDVYGQSKIEAEDLILNSKLDWSIFRLSAIMKNHKISKLMFHMPLNTVLEICTPGDVAKAFVEAINKREVLSKRIFNLGGGEKCCITYKIFLEKSFQLFGLGTLNFPPNTFARRNFHCGILKDGDVLENILHFRHDTLDTYFADTKRSISFVKRFACTLFRVFIKKGLLNQSEPLHAFKTKDQQLLMRFF
jgi:nucleoside-diphosphate-sugar epimerase